MTEVKRGSLKYYHRGLLSKKWKEYRFILYDSSLLTWYADIKHRKPDGMVLLKDVERFICVGPYTKYLPDFPHLEHEYDQMTLIAFPLSVKNRDRDIVWLLCEDIDELNSWMKAIVQTLPSHSLKMEKLPKVSSSSSTDENPAADAENSTKQESTENVESITVRANPLVLPLAAGVLGSRFQGRPSTSKMNPLQRAGYDYGDTLWGVGEGWGNFSSSEDVGFAGLGGGLCYPDRIELEHQQETEQRTEEIEEHMEKREDQDDVVEEISYELSGSHLGDDENQVSVEYEGIDNDVEHEELKMIDSDGEK